MAIAISVALFCLLLAVITWAGYRLWAKPVRIHERLGAAGSAGRGVEGEDGESMPAQWVVKVVEQVGEKAPISPQDARTARRYLIAAGYRSDAAVKMYYGAKFVLCGLMLLLALFVRGYIDNPVLSIIAVVAAACIGFFAPNFFVEHVMDKRKERIRLSLPDALDLMVVCMEAGLGLDQAIANVSRELKETHKEISEELSLVTLEMRAGKRRSDALKNLADRTGEKELRKLVATMVQADRFGTGVAESLRTHSEFMRVRRRQQAEERAGKVGVKLVFPIFFFILPSMLVVAAGPGLLMLFKGLFPMMKQM